MSQDALETLALLGCAFGVVALTISISNLITLLNIMNNKPTDRSGGEDA